MQEKMLGNEEGKVRGSGSSSVCIRGKSLTSYCIWGEFLFIYSRTPLIRINWDGEPPGFEENPDNWILL